MKQGGGPAIASRPNLIENEPVGAESRWETAYRAFESPEEEVRKFRRRLQGLGADGWDRHSRVVEVCSGRGSGLRAWHSLGYPNVLGVDLSSAMVSGYDGPGRCIRGDARSLPLDNGSCGIAAVQGGLHHLASEDDVERALSEMRRVVGPRGRVLLVEPWPTPFLGFVHSVCRIGLARRLSKKIDALATMIEEERETYERWLSAPAEHLALVERYVRPQVLRYRWGKIVAMGSPDNP